MLFEGEFYDNKKWNGKGYNYDGNLEFQLKDDNGKIKEYDNNKGKLIF